MNVVTSDEVLTRFGRSPSGRRAFESWKSDPRRAQVAPQVLAHQNTVLANSTSAAIRQVALTTEHALGDTRRADGESLRRIVDWHPNFAMTHVLSFISESLNRVPTYQEFREAARTPEFRSMLWEPAQRVIAAESEHGPNVRLARAGMRWRIGNSYYSFLREAYVMACLRERGVEVRSHPLADALFHVDFWVGDVNVDLYIGNQKFRQGRSGRKQAAAELLSDAEPRFKSVAIEMPTANRFGVVHLPDDASVTSAAQEISELCAR